MGNLFKKSGWKSNGSDELNVSAGGGNIGVAASGGQMFFDDPYGTKYQFNFKTVGASAGVGISPVNFELTTTDLPSSGAIYVNTKWRDKLQVSDFTGPFLIYQATGTTVIGGLGKSGALIFFDIGYGLYTGLVASIATAGFGAAIAPAAVISSCSSVFMTTGSVVGSVSAGVTGALGVITSYEKKLSDIVGIWNINTNSTDFKYAFYSNGSCSWFKEKNMINPDGAGRWEMKEKFLEINWDSGSVERWNAPIVFKNQMGGWKAPSGKLYTTLANKTDIWDVALG